MPLIKIAVDAMSGDRGLKTVVPACINSLKKHDHLNLVLVGNERAISRAIKNQPQDILDRITIRNASQVVGMDESPSKALRNKKDSSLRVAIEVVKSGEASACVSSGNTGALMATARFVLKTLPGIDRPAIIGPIPSSNASGRVHLLDLGANVDTSAEHLFQFAVMGSVLAKAIEGVKRPRVALLNIGEEEIKGNDCIKLAASMLDKCPDVNYIGFVEGDGIFSGEADVIVCDGFVGNVALKTMEGSAKYFIKTIKQSFEKNFFSKISAALAYIVLRSIKKRLNPDLYNGATFIGLRGIVIKSHGGTSVLGFEAAIERALIEVAQNVPRLIENEVARICEQEYQ